MKTSFIQFASGHAFRADALSYIAPVFVLRQAVNLSVVAGPDSPDTQEPTIHLTNLVEVDAEYHAYGSFPDFMVVAKEPAQQILQNSSDSISDSPFFLAALMAMNVKLREKFVDEVTADVRQIYKYHAQWRDAVSILNPSDDDVGLVQVRSLGVTSKGEAITPALLAKRITNRALYLKQRLTDAGILKSSVSEPVDGALGLVDLLTTEGIVFSSEDVLDTAGSLPTFRWIDHVDSPVTNLLSLTATPVAA